MASFQIFVAYILATTLVLTAAGAKNRTLHILCLLPYNEPPFYPSWDDGPQIRLALEMAKEEINNQTAILPEYRIELIHNNSGCQHTSKTYEAVFANVYSQFAPKQVVGIIGPGCSSSSAAAGSLLGREQLSLVTVHSGGSLILANRTTYRYALSSISSSEKFAKLAVELMIKNSWTKVGVLFEETRTFYSSIASGVQKLVSLNRTLSIVSTPVFNTYIPLRELVRKNGLRINFLLTAKDITQRTLCLAQHFGMVYPAYQWIVTVNTFDEIASNVSFYYEGKKYTCSEKDIKTIALDRSLFLVYRLSAINESSPSTYSRHSFNEYDQLIRKGIEESNLQSGLLNRPAIEYSVWTSYFYDSLWAWSVVLDSLANKSLDLRTYKYGNTTVSDMILDKFYRLDFEGVSGRIAFDNKSGFGLRSVSVLQVTNGIPKAVAYLKNGNTLIPIDDRLESIPDKFNSADTVSNEVVGIFFTITFIELVVLVVLNLLTYKYRTHPSIKASSIKLNQIMFVGCYCFILTIFFFTLQSSKLLSNVPWVTVALCNLSWYWLLPLSFTLTFGTVAVRTWRLYRIFTHYLNPGRFITDFYLIVFVFILLLIDVLFGTILTTLNPQHFGLVNTTAIDGNAKFLYYFRTCGSQIPALTIGLVVGPKALLMAAVLMLTVLTRNIKSKSFTTKTLRILIYLTIPVMVLGFVIYHFFYFDVPTLTVPFYSSVITFNIMLVLFVALICFPPLLPKLQEGFYKIVRKNKPLYEARVQIQINSLPISF